MKCTFCGHAFDVKEARIQCQGCFLKKGCGLVQCPHCRFELVEEPKEGIPEKKPEEIETTSAAVIDITRWPIGREARVAGINTSDRAAMRKLIAMGVLPDTKIRLIQKFPSYVFQAGPDRFTLDAELASQITVRAL